MSEPTTTTAAFKALFAAHYQSNLTRGLEPNAAVAQALLDAQREMLPAPVAPTACPVTAATTAPPTKATSTTSPLPPLKVEPARPLARELTVEYVQSLVSECSQGGTFVPTALIRAVGSFFSDLDTVVMSFEPQVAPSDQAPMDAVGGDSCVALVIDDTSSAMHVVSSETETETGAVGSRTQVSLDIESVRAVYHLLLDCGSEGVGNALLHALDSLAFQMQSSASSHSSGASIKPYLIILEHPDLLDPKYGSFLSKVLQVRKRYFLRK